MTHGTVRAAGGVREDVAEAALAVFLAKGYDRATVREIADRAGLRVSSLYAHIGSKEALFVELIRPVLEVGTEWVESVAESDLPAEDKLRLACIRAGELYDQHPAVAIYLSNYSGEIANVVPDLIRRSKVAWEKVVGACLPDGGQEADEVTVVTYGILGMFSWMHRWYRQGGRRTGRQIGASYAEILLEGLRRGASRPEPPETLDLVRESGSDIESLSREVQRQREEIRALRESIDRLVGGQA